MYLDSGYLFIETLAKTVELVQRTTGEWWILLSFIHTTSVFLKEKYRFSIIDEISTG